MRRILGIRTTASLVTAFVISRLDYCNSVLAGLPKSSIAPLQRVQNAAARLICALGPHDHVTPSLRELHWLPVEQRIIFKLCALMHLVHTGRGPSYLCDLVTLGRLKRRERKTGDSQKRRGAKRGIGKLGTKLQEIARVENAGFENAGSDCRGG